MLGGACQHVGTEGGQHLWRESVKTVVTSHPGRPSGGRGGTSRGTWRPGRVRPRPVVQPPPSLPPATRTAPLRVLRPAFPPTVGPVHRRRPATGTTGTILPRVPSAHPVMVALAPCPRRLPGVRPGRPPPPRCAPRCPTRRPTTWCS